MNEICHFVRRPTHTGTTLLGHRDLKTALQGRGECRDLAATSARSRRVSQSHGNLHNAHAIATVNFYFLFFLFLILEVEIFIF